MTSSFDSTLGAAFIGGLGTAILYGVTCVQAFMFFQRSETDTTRLKIIVGFLWITDTLHLAFVAHSLYWYMVTQFTNPEAVQLIPWTIMAGICVTNISDTLTRGFFTWRVWVLSEKNRVLTGVLAILVVFIFISGFGFGVKGFSIKSFQEFATISWLLYTGFAMAVTGDFYIATSLCTFLFQARTGFKRTDSLVHVLMVYSINTGLVTSICSLICFITYAALPHTFIFLAFYFPLSKLYVNALLATLNARRTLRSRSVVDSSVSTPRSRPFSSVVIASHSDSTTIDQRFTIQIDK